MKGVVFVCLMLCVHLRAAEADEDNRSIGLKMIEAAKSAASNLLGNKKSIKSILDMFRGSAEEPDDKPRPNVVVNSAEGKIELTIDLDKKETSESVDSKYTMDHFKNALAQIKEQLVALVQMQKDFEDSRPKGDEDDRDRALEFNHKVVRFAIGMYPSQDIVKRDIVILETNLAYLKEPSFRVCDFYFDGHYRMLENRIYKEGEPVMDEAKKKYLLERSKLMWNIADAKKFITMMSSNFDGLFSFHQKLMFYYNMKKNNREDLKSIDEDVVDSLEAMFTLRVHIAENLQFILREIDAFEEYKDNFQQIFEDADQKAEAAQLHQSSIQDSGINDEEYFKAREKQAKEDTMQISIEENLATGKITMEDITDADMADRIISNPLLGEAPEEPKLVNMSLGFGII